MLFLLIIQTAAQKSETKAYTPHRVVSAYTDSLRILTESRNKKIQLDTDVPGTPYLYKLIGPITYYSNIVTDSLRLNQSTDTLSHSATEAMRWKEVSSDIIDGQLIGIYINSPSLISHHDSQFAEEELISTPDNATEESIRQTVLNEVPTIEDVSSITGDIDIGMKVKRPDFWKKSGSFSLQFTQNYFSDNWYKGGNNNGTMLSTLSLEAKYDDTKRVTWENKIEMRLGFVTTTSDSCHTFLTNNDKIRLYTKLGIKATKSWFYTISAEGNSQFMPGYKTNDRKKYSQFLSPLDVYVSIGMDFKPSFKNGNTLSVALLPLSYKLRLISSDDSNIHSAYGMHDEYSKHDYGSKIELNSKVTIVKNLTWKCRLFYFTSYEYAEAELENVFSFAFSKYISSELYSLWRFDDNRSKRYYDDNLGYFQFKEYLTFGLKYSF